MSDTAIFYIKKAQRANRLEELDTVAFLLTINRVMSIADREQVAKHLMQRKGELSNVNNKQ